MQTTALWLILALGAQEPFRVYKPVVSQCPASWIDAVSAEVATSEVISLVDVKGLKRSIGIPMALRSCNTSIYGDYVFEGNVPPEAIKSFLAAPPKGAVGLSLPGSENDRESKRVYLFYEDGNYTLFGTY